MSSNKFFPYTRQWTDESDAEAVKAIFENDMLTRGPKVEAFEAAVADYCGAEHAVAFSNGTAALHAAYFAAGVGPYHKVVTSPLTYIGTVVGAHTLGAQLSFSDIDPTTGNLDLEKMGEAPTTTRGQAVYVPVHYAGVPIDMRRFAYHIRESDAIVIEDAAHAFGASYSDKSKVGCCAHSDMTVFSFHPAKTITAGEGGMVVTNDPALRRRLRLFRNNGIESGPVEAITGNFHMGEIPAALGLSQLDKTNAVIKKRRALVRAYRKRLAEVPNVTLLPEEHDALSAHHLFVTLIDFEKCGTTRQAVMEKLKERGIGTQVHYRPLYQQPVLKSPSDPQSEYPGTEKFYAHALSLPLYYSLTEGNVKVICEGLAEVLANRPE